MSRPPSGIASLAFTARLMSACSSCALSQRTTGALGSRRVDSSTPSPIVRSRKFSVSSTSSLTPTATGFAASGVEKTSSLACELRRALAGTGDLAERLGHVAIGIGRPELGIVEDHCEQVVEVVGDAAGQAPDAIELL